MSCSHSGPEKRAYRLSRWVPGAAHQLDGRIFRKTRRGTILRRTRRAAGGGHKSWRPHGLRVERRAAPGAMEDVLGTVVKVAVLHKLCAALRCWSNLVCSSPRLLKWWKSASLSLRSRVGATTFAPTAESEAREATLRRTCIHLVCFACTGKGPGPHR